MFAAMKPFEIFRTGRQLPKSGTPIDFSASDLAGIAASYDPALHQAPIVVGHPKTDGPAYGWVSKVEVVGDRLVATPAEIEPAFSELVTSGRFKKVSASFYPPKHPANPTPGSYALRHVGFLGAEPPAVKGLKPIEFSVADDGDLLTVEFSDWSTSSALSASARLFRRLRDWFVAEKGVEAADDLLPEWEVEDLLRASIRSEPSAATMFSEPRSPERKPMPDPTPGPDAAELAQRASDLAARELAFSERQAKTRAIEDAAFVAAIVEAGRLPKVLEASAAALFSELGEDVLEFGEGDAAETTTPREAFRKLLSALPTPVVTGEVAKGGTEDLDFSDPVTTAGLITTEIKAAKDKGEEISAAQAIDRLKGRAK